MVAAVKDANRCHGVPACRAKAPSRKASPLGEQIASAAVQVSIGAIPSSTRPSHGPSWENSRTKRAACCTVCPSRSMWPGELPLEQREVDHVNVVIAVEIEADALGCDQPATRVARAIHKRVEVEKVDG